MTKSEQTFATFRVAGDDLVPDQLTALLRIKPTTAYSKGQFYNSGPHGGTLKGRTGVWLLSTDGVVESSRLVDHINWILNVIEPHLAQLGQYMSQNSLHAVMSCFWHGPQGAHAPFVPKDIRNVIEKIPAKVEEDFDTDDGLAVPVKAHVR